ncbi:NAD(P)-dependent oxidoreductase, partial [Bradyrhizobium sp.]|uniref:NAD(P)-dependent oxidoreductase n=1 Tax=Bradyrhizobium sp. TaxID=376 RepID=UPI0023893013
MRFLPVFLDLTAGSVLLIGAGDILQAKLRVLAAAGAHIRVHALDGNRELCGLSVTEAERVAFADGDPLTADLSGVIAIVCAGAGEIGVAM